MSKYYVVDEDGKQVSLSNMDEDDAIEFRNKLYQADGGNTDYKVKKHK